MIEDVRFVGIRVGPIFSYRLYCICPHAMYLPRYLLLSTYKVSLIRSMRRGRPLGASLGLDPGYAILIDSGS